MASAKKSSGGRTYSRGASASVGRALHEEKRGTLRRGRQGHGGKVTDPKQAIAIALNEARERVEQVPPPPRGSASATRPTGAKKASAKKSSAKKASAKTSGAKKAGAKRATAKRPSAKKSSARKSGAKRTSATR